MVGANAVTLANLPGSLDLGVAVLGRELRPVTFEVIRGEADIAWDALRAGTGNIQSKIEKIGNDRWKVTVTPPQEKIVGNKHEKLDLKLLNAGTLVQRKRVDLSWKTISKIFSLTPASLYLKGNKGAKLKVKSLRGNPVRLTKIEYPEGFPGTVTEFHERNELLLGLVALGKKGGQIGEKQETSIGRIRITLSDVHASEVFAVSVIY